MTPRISQLRAVFVCAIFSLLLSSTLFVPSANAQATCSPPAGVGPTVYYMTDNGMQGAEATAVIGGKPIDYDADTIRYEYHLEIDPAIAAAISTASEVCLKFTTQSRVWSMNNGTAMYSASIKTGHKPANAPKFQTLAQFIDMRDTQNGDNGHITTQYEESLSGIVLNSGDQVGLVVNGFSVADARTGSHFDQASLWWFIDSVQIGAPRLLVYP